MKMNRSFILPAVLALVLSLAIITVATLMSIPILQTTTTSTSATSSSSGQSGPQGTLSILLTDPPNAPAGVTKVYVTYSNLQVHVSEAGNQSGWTQVKQQGTIELMGTVNISQTISSAKVPSGDYNLIRFNISSAQVTFNGKNYTGFVPSAELTVPIIHGIEVNASKPSATIINITPTVVNIGSDSTPEFIVRPVATAYPVPSSGVTSDIENDGFRLNLNAQVWWKHIQQQYTANLQLSSATLTTNSFSITALNTGNSSTTLRLVTISPLAGVLVGDHGKMHNFPTIFGSAVYVVLPNGTILPVQNIFPTPMMEGESHGTVANAFFGQGGLVLAAGASHTLDYSGSIQLGFSLHIISVGTVVPGQQYLITVLGDQSVASIVVVAK